MKAGDQAPSTRTVPTLADTLDVEPGELAAPDEVAAARMLGRRCGRGQSWWKPQTPRCSPRGKHE